MWSNDDFQYFISSWHCKYIVPLSVFDQVNVVEKCSLQDDNIVVEVKSVLQIACSFMALAKKIEKFLSKRRHYIIWCNVTPQFGHLFTWIYLSKYVSSAYSRLVIYLVISASASVSISVVWKILTRKVSKKPQFRFKLHLITPQSFDRILK